MVDPKISHKRKALNLDVQFEIAVHLDSKSKNAIAVIYHICVVFIDENK